MLCPTGLGNEGTEREQAFVAVHAVISGYVVTNQSQQCEGHLRYA